MLNWNKTAILLDMNGTFMFGEDRFDECTDFSVRYFEIGGALSKAEINRIVWTAYRYLDARYPDELFRHNFPTVEQAILEVAGCSIDAKELNKVIDTFAFHELGFIPSEYAAALHHLRQRFTLAAIIDIWSPKAAWLVEFDRAGISGLFSAVSFSSDHGIVKPSPKPFELVLNQLGLASSEAIMVGDSVRRDLGGAKNAGVECVLVGGATHPDALLSISNLLQLAAAL